MAPLVYVLGTIVTLLCAVLLFRAYASVRRKLLLWSAICFAGLTVSNALLFLDLVVIPNVNLHPLRLATAALSMLVLLFGLVWESDG
jgi:Family of unknown function (DUF5985)